MSDISNVPGLELDPFSFHSDEASCISGLGGSERGIDPHYAFHTPYVEAEPGFCHFIVRFEGLTAKTGTLQLGVYMLPLEPKSHARVANRDRIQLNRLAQRSGAIEVRFEAFAGVSFALHGQVSGDTDAKATRLTIFLDRPSDPVNRKPASEARNSEFGRDHVRAAVHLLSTSPADLVSPVSQLATEAQLREPAFARWQKALGTEKNALIDQWSGAFVMQVLDRYGLLQKGASGLFLGADSATAVLTDLLRSLGVSVTAPSKLPLSTKNRTTPNEFQPEDVPGELINFDFLWSDNIAEEYVTFADALRFIENSLNCLRPGGLAIHLVPFDVALDEPAIERPHKLLFQRRHIERVSLVLISRKLEVAAIKIDAKQPLFAGEQDGRPVARFALIARRPQSAY